jgi:hypothetical protein
MIIIFLITYVANALDCTLELTGTKVIGASTGSFTATFTAPELINYAEVTSSSNWNLDSNTQIQSSTFACYLKGTNCDPSTANATPPKTIKCTIISPNPPSTDITCSGMNTPAFTGDLDFG